MVILFMMRHSAAVWLDSFAETRITADAGIELGHSLGNRFVLRRDEQKKKKKK